MALEEYHGRGILGRVVPGELGVADLVFRGGQRGEGEKAEQGEGTHG